MFYYHSSLLLAFVFVSDAAGHGDLWAHCASCATSFFIVIAIGPGTVLGRPSSRRRRPRLDDAFYVFNTVVIIIITTFLATQVLIAFRQTVHSIVERTNEFPGRMGVVGRHSIAKLVPSQECSKTIRNFCINEFFFLLSACLANFLSS